MCRVCRPDNTLASTFSLARWLRGCYGLGMCVYVAKPARKNQMNCAYGIPNLEQTTLTDKATRLDEYFEYIVYVYKLPLWRSAVSICIKSYSVCILCINMDLPIHILSTYAYKHFFFVLGRRRINKYKY